MTERPLKILQVVSEMFPYSKTGGLGFVTADIAYNLANAGHDVTVITPLFGSVWKKIKKKNVETVLVDIPIKIDSTTTITCSCIKYVRHNGSRKPITFYFINHYDFFGRYTRNLYSHREMHKRFYFFSKAVVKIIEELEMNFDIVHTHDWMTGLVPKLIKEELNFKKKSRPQIMLTIHNLAFQGSSYLNQHRFEKRLQGPPIKILPLFTADSKWEKINFLKQGIKEADMITTVSSTYAQEIMTPKFGEGLSNFLYKNRPIYGILNGIDYKTFNPSTSKIIFKRFNTLNYLNRKKINKEYLIKLLKLPKSYINYPFIVTNHRLTFQKGFDLIAQDIKQLMKMNVVLIIMGDGDKRYIEEFHELNKKYRNFAFVTPFSDVMEQRILAAGDIILCPSIYEPCGTGHMRGMRYGVVPVARKTGGLADTISDFDAKKNSGTGFLFLEYDKNKMLFAIKRAVKVFYSDKKAWKELSLRCMSQSFTWEKSIEEYTYLYRKLLRKKRR